MKRKTQMHRRDRMGTDYQDARQKMVDNQIRTTDVTSHSVLKAFLTVAREDFVPTLAQAAGLHR
jgi:hypothetical protein